MPTAQAPSGGRIVPASRTLHPGRRARGPALAVIATLAVGALGPVAAKSADRLPEVATTAVRVLPVPRPHMLGAGSVETARAEVAVVVPIIHDTPPPSPRETPQRTVVRVIQQHLSRRGYDPGPLDGRLGTQTRRAIRAFQRDCGLAVTGAVGDALIDRLVGADACRRDGAR